MSHLVNWEMVQRMFEIFSQSFYEAVRNVLLFNVTHKVYAKTNIISHLTFATEGEKKVDN